MKDKKLKLAGIILTGILVLGTFVYAITVQPTVYGNMDFPYYELQTFDSYEELTEFLGSSSYQYSSSNWRVQSLGSMDKLFEDTAAPNVMRSDESGGETVDYSQTNVQVAGVDEPDVVKTDGMYLYIVSNGKIIIVKTYPTEDADIECEITFNDSIYVQNVFINNLRLVLPKLMIILSTKAVQLMKCLLLYGIVLQIHTLKSLTWRTLQIRFL